MLEAKPLDLPATPSLALLPARFIFSLAAKAGAVAELERALGVILPSAGRQTCHDGVTYLWAGPGSWLAMAQEPVLQPRLAAASPYAAITEQSDGRAMFRVAGANPRETLQKLIPVDLAPSVFLADHTALTLAGHIPVQLWREGDGFVLACFRSFGAALHHALAEAETPIRG